MFRRLSALVTVLAGVGSLTMFERTGLSVNDDTTFLVGNVGGAAPSFFGQDNRYGHRLYTGVIINAAR